MAMRNATPQVKNLKSHWVLARAMTQRSSSRRCPTWCRAPVAVSDDIAKADGYAICSSKDLAGPDSWALFAR